VTELKYSYIATRGEYAAYLRTFEDKKYSVVALDLEAEMNRHQYGEQLCLLQVYDGESAVIIDPLRITAGRLKDLLENRDILKVMYDASSDKFLLKNTYNIDIKTILDLRPAVELLDYEKKDLHSVIFAELGIALEQKEKFQTQNWTRRPIDPLALEYAVNDVVHLLRLKDAIFKKLYERGLLDRFFLQNLQIQGKDYTRNPRDRYGKIKGFHHLAEGQEAIFRRIYDIRDKHARRLNMPPNNVVSNVNLVALARGAKSPEELRFPRRLPPHLVRGILGEIKEALREAG
jgi:ribonuclease D